MSAATANLNPPARDSGTETPNGCSLTRFVSCVRALGWWLGWKYWRIQNKVMRNPEAAKEWALRCRREAIKSPKELAGCFLDWAVKLEDSMEKWNEQQEAANAKLSRPAAE